MKSKRQHNNGSWENEYTNIGEIHRKGDISVFNLSFDGLKGGSVAFFSLVASEEEKRDFWIGTGTVIYPSTPCKGEQDHIVIWDQHWFMK